MSTIVGYFFSSFFKYVVTVPYENGEFLGIVKGDNIILFEMVNNTPVKVWRNTENRWKEEAFIGYQIITEYSVNEIRFKRKLIKEALKTHWNAVNSSVENIHGDLTHFNILVDDGKGFHFIDKKRIKNSKLFDFYYFYAYLKQSLIRCRTLNASDKLKTIAIIETILKEVCQYKSYSEFIYDFEQIVIPEISGLQNNTKYNHLNDFGNLFIGKFV
ncbi:MAG: hypothetical protein HQ521_10455 [Bacteroidetes bacterium]|nr:hypothetical protein [Bacteroidota bacterium]